MADEIKLNKPVEPSVSATPKPVLKPVLKPAGESVKPAGSNPTIRKMSPVAAGAVKPVVIAGNTIKAAPVKNLGGAVSPTLKGNSPRSVTANKPGTVISSAPAKSEEAEKSQSPAKPEEAVKSGKKIVSAKPIKSVKAEKKPKQKAKHEDLGDDMYAKSPRCVWATILMILTFLASLACVGVLMLSLFDISVMAGVRQGIGSAAANLKEFNVGPIDSEKLMTGVKEAIDKVDKSVKASESMIADTQAFLAPDVGDVVEPEPADEPMDMEEPVVEAPEPVDEPMDMEEPVVEAPEPVDEPMDMEEPVVEAPEPVDEPMDMEEPAVVDEPIDLEEPAVEDSVVPEPVIEDPMAGDSDDLGLDDLEDLLAE